MISASWNPYRLDFLFEARTSRERMWHKDTYFIELRDESSGRTARGEAALFRGLSADDVPEYESLLDYYCTHPEEALSCPYSSIRMGFETAFADLRHPGVLFPGAEAWASGHEAITINGLVWMGDKATMLERIREKINAGFGVIKLKIGGINFEDECDLLRAIRTRFSRESITLRLDANGSFTPANAMKRLEALAAFDIHSIEQPLRAGLIRETADLCRKSPIAIALDEELIGVRSAPECEALLDEIRPQYIILKPTLCGGFSGADCWIETAEKRGIGWWATSALESNIGLHAIACWLAPKNPVLPQGLGTGQLYSNNIPSGMCLLGDKLYGASPRL